MSQCPAWPNFTSDQFTGFHAIVVPGTIRDSLYVLDGLLKHETSLEVSEIGDGHGHLQRPHLWAVPTAGVSVQPQARRPRPHAVLAYQSPRGIRAAEQSCTESIEGKGATVLPGLCSSASAASYGGATKRGRKISSAALDPVVNAIVLWNARYMDAVLSQLQADGDAIADADVRRLSPLVHKHLNFLGPRSAALSVHSCSVATQTPKPLLLELRTVPQNRIDPGEPPRSPSAAPEQLR